MISKLKDTFCELVQKNEEIFDLAGKTENPVNVNDQSNIGLVLTENPVNVNGQSNVDVVQTENLGNVAGNLNHIEMLSQVMLQVI